MESEQKTLEQKREEMTRESWIKNVMRVMGVDRETAERQYNMIYHSTDAPQSKPEEAQTREPGFYFLKSKRKGEWTVLKTIDDGREPDQWAETPWFGFNEDQYSEAIGPLKPESFAEISKLREEIEALKASNAELVATMKQFIDVTSDYDPGDALMWAMRTDMQLAIKKYEAQELLNKHKA